MRVKHINVNIVKRNTQIEVVWRHTYSLYMKVKLLKVNIVSRNTTNRGSLKTHIQYIHEGKTFQCQHCEQKFISRGCLKSIHEGKTFQCQHFDKKYTERGSLKTHIQSIHKGKIFPCQHCEQKFTQKGERDISTNTQSPYIKVKHFNVNIADIKQQQKVISRLTYCPNKGDLLIMTGKRFLYF